MTEARRHKAPGPDHPITVEPFDSPVVVRSGDVVIGRTDRALELQEASYPPVLYVPLDDVDQRLLRLSDHHTYCPYKGEASYYDIVGEGGSDGAPGTLADVVWFYADPFPAVGAIRDHVAFYDDRVTVDVTPRPRSDLSS